MHIPTLYHLNQREREQEENLQWLLPWWNTEPIPKEILKFQETPWIYIDKWPEKTHVLLFVEPFISLITDKKKRQPLPNINQCYDL